MNLYRISEDNKNNIMHFVDRFLKGDVKMSSVLEAEQYKSAAQDIASCLDKSCNDEFVLKEKVDSIQEAEVFVNELEKKREEKKSKKDNK